MKWSLFNWKKPVVSSGEPEDYQVVKNTVSQNSTNIRDLNNQVQVAQGTADRNEQSITNINNQLNNTVSTNTAQTITGAKTFNEGITINKTPIPLLLKATSNDKSYIVFRDSANNSNLSIGANATSTSIEVNRGDLTIQTQQPNKTVSFETGTIKTNRARLEFGTEINAGFGGGVVKFIPEDNSTKTLQFFNNNATDQRCFNLKINEPTEATNPATKNYVDTKETAINNQITAINNRIVENNTILKRKYVFTPTSSTPNTWGDSYSWFFRITDVQNWVVMGVSPNFGNVNGSSQQAATWQTTWGMSNNNYLTITLTINKAYYDLINANLPGVFNIDFSVFNVEVFYMLTNTNREAEQTYQGQVLSLEEVFGGNNEN